MAEIIRQTIVHRNAEGNLFWVGDADGAAHSSLVIVYSNGETIVEKENNAN